MLMPVALSAVTSFDRSIRPSVISTASNTPYCATLYRKYGVTLSRYSATIYGETWFLRMSPSNSNTVNISDSASSVATSEEQQKRKKKIRMGDMKAALMLSVV